MPHRRLALLLSVVAVVVLGVGCGERTWDEGDVAVEPIESPYEVQRKPHAVSDGLATEREALNLLRLELSRPDATILDVNSTLALVRMMYMYPSPPPGTPLYAPSPGTPEDNRRPVPEPDLDAHAEQHDWPVEYVQEVRAFRRETEKLYLKAMTLWRSDPDSAGNRCDAVNVRAAQLLAETRNRALSGDVLRAMRRTVLRSRRESSRRLKEEAFAALATLGDRQDLEWMIDTYVRTAFEPQAEVDLINAAHKAMPLFDRDAADGGLRHRLVNRMAMSFAVLEPVEVQPGNDLARQIVTFWSQIGPDAIRTTQYFAGDPTDADGQPLDTMEELAEWFRDHDDPSKPPWTD